MKMDSNIVLSRVRSLLVMGVAFSCVAAAGQESVAKPDYVVARSVINIFILLPVTAMWCRKLSMVRALFHWRRRTTGFIFAPETTIRLGCGG